MEKIAFFPQKEGFSTTYHQPQVLDEFDDDQDDILSQDEKNLGLLVPQHEILLSLKRKWWKPLLIWQILSLCICGTGVFSMYLAQNGLRIPALQSVFLYLSLIIVWLISYVRVDCKRLCMSSENSLKINWYIYIFGALCDVEANFLLVKSYQYTSLSSVQLLDCFTVPSVMFLSYCFLKKRYNFKHFGGAFFCICGIIILVFSDNMVEKDNSDSLHQNSLLGDMLVICGAILYAISNVVQEHAVRTDGSLRWIKMLGIWGSVISLLQVVIFEKNELQSLDWVYFPNSLFLLGFVLCLLCIYIVTPILLTVSTATVMNLSFLTADFWAAMFSFLLFSAHLNVLFFISFFVIITGTVIYTAGG